MFSKAYLKAINLAKSELQNKKMGEIIRPFQQKLMSN